MATTTTQTVDVAQQLKELLDGITGLRSYSYVSDATRPPAAVIGQPDIDFLDNQSGFCTATWIFPVSVVVARNNDREAQTQMSRLLMEITQALSVEVPGIFSIEPMDARPIVVSVGQQELPAYLVNIRVRA